MTYRAQLDVLLHFHSISTLLFRNQGLIKLRAFLSYHNNKDQQVSAHPYSIIKSKPEQRAYDSYIDESSQGYYSHSIQVSYNPDDYLLEQACIFRAYIPVDEFDHIEFSCVVELLYSPDYSQSSKSIFEIFGRFQCRITKLSRLADYLPVAFDEYGGCIVKASYHSIVLEFKFIKQQTDEEYSDLWQYMEAITSGFQKTNIRRFYGYYRNRIEEQFLALQEMYAQLRKASAELQQPRRRFIKNSKLQTDIDRLVLSKSTAHNYEMINKLIESIMQEFSVMKGVCYKYWNQYIEAVLKRSGRVVGYYSQGYRQRVLERFKTNVFSHNIRGKDWTIARYNDCGQSNLMQAEKQKNKNYQQLWAEEFPIENVDYFQDPHKSVKIFEQSYCINPNLSKSQSAPILHVFVLVHGFQASHKDFSIIKNYLLARPQPTEVLLSVVNQGRTSFNIEALGSRLAFEVADFITTRLNKKKFRLSFIGHSMGGIIIRTALRHLQRFWPYLYSYISFSSPHMGYLNISSKVVEAGLWYLNNWQKCDSIRQLMMIDSQDPLKSFMFRLSQQDILKHFKNVALVSSYQDGFVSHQSARIQKSAQLIFNSTRNDKNAAVLCRMADNILSPNIQNLYRIDVVFEIDQKNIDSLVGRTGHIKFLSDSHFLRIFVNTFDHLFK